MLKLIAHAVATSLALFTLSDGPAEKASTPPPAARAGDGTAPAAKPAEPARAPPGARADPTAPPAKPAQGSKGTEPARATDPKPCEPVKPCAID